MYTSIQIYRYTDISICLYIQYIVYIYICHHPPKPTAQKIQMHIDVPRNVCLEKMLLHNVQCAINIQYCCRKVQWSTQLASFLEKYGC